MPPLPWVPDLDVPAGFVSEMRAAYADPPRHYHTWDHALAVIAAEADLPWVHPKEAWFAAIFHDAVYVAGAHDNEERSANLAVASIARWFPGREIDVDRVARLVRLTARHGALTPADVDADAALFLDCDMAVLASSDAEFAAYDRGIRLEYGAMPAELFAQGRRAFLAKLLASERIFLSDVLHERLDARARANLRRALG